MADFFNPNTVAFNGEEIRSISEAVFESVFAKPELEQFHEVVNGIVVKKQIAIIGRLASMVGAGDGDCDPEDGVNTIPMSQKMWEPVTVSDRLALCWKDIADTFWTWGLKQGIAKPDLTATDFANFVSERLEDAMWEMIYRLVWFNDVDAADVDASPAGALTSGTNEVYFNKLDGLWKQITEITVATPARLTAGIDSRNGQASYALQEFTTTDTTNKVVTNTLLNMKFGADYRLRGKQNLIYIATQSVRDQYERELINANISFTTERMENGIEVLKNGGIVVYSFQFWDRIIREFYDNGTTYLLPHRVILVEKTNLRVGTGEVDAFSEVDLFYDKKTKKTYFDFQFDIDAKIIEDEMIQVAW